MRITESLLPLTALLAAACHATNHAPEAQVEASTSTTVDEAQAAALSGELADEADLLSLSQQKQAYLVGQHLAAARSLMDNLRLEEAEGELAQALAIDPDNLDAKQLMAEVGGLLGRPAGEVASVTRELRDRFALRTQQLRAEAEDSLRQGKLMLARGDYDAAIGELTICLNHINWAPYSVDWRGIDVDAAKLLERAQADRAAVAEVQRVESQRQSHAALQAQEQAQRGREEMVTATMVERAITAFEDADYDDAIHHAEQALRRNPRHEQASEIRASAFRAGREKVQSDYVLAKREQFARWREEMRELMIPWTEVITVPDQDRWAEITELRQGRRGLDLTQTVSASEQQLSQSLRATTIPGLVTDEEESLMVVVGILRTVTGLPLVVDPAAENAVLDEGFFFTFNFNNPLTVEQALNLICNQAGEEVTWTIRHDAVMVTTLEKARGELIIINHDVQDLIFGLTDFLGPRIDTIRLLGELEDDDGGGPFGAIGERPRLIEIEDLSTLIQDNVAVGTWDGDGITVEPGEGYILMTHTPAVQQEVRDFLNDLRTFSSSLVTIESKFMTVSDNWLQELGVDFRGLDNVNLEDVDNGLEDNASLGLDNSGTGTEGQNAAGPPSAGFFYDDGGDGDFRGTIQNFFGDGLGNALSTIGGLTTQLTFLNDLQVSAILRAVEKSSQFELINDQVLSVHNTQRAFVTVINQRAFIQDFDVEVAQFQAVADPQVNVIHEGVVLDVRPTIHHDRKYLTLEVQPTVANVVAMRDFSSTLGGNTSPVEFQLPEVQVQSVMTTAVIPDGGSILLGGLSNIRNIERRAEVPWFARIPVLGFLFKEEGYSDEKESLMILIRAHITDVREELAKIEGGAQ
ncbi:MAG: hypothetical protein QF724_03645 [Planctomycetota bacterium]|jgi:tetratricopeptide (TPR) repeat protein|nr:hypothetical protein [Planctomycetota bacterium]